MVITKADEVFGGGKLRVAISLNLGENGSPGKKREKMFACFVMECIEKMRGGGGTFTYKCSSVSLLVCSTESASRIGTCQKN